ncbi:MAG TPA: septum formation initiator family protein [Solirubrobacteraceae bacterium]|nr:septum formation initiator family protein [Solirubrobacteraceae bacterium]
MGRLALLFVLALLVYLYIGPLSSLVTTWHASKERETRVAELEEVQARLRTRRDELRDPRALEREARELGMVRPGERSFVVAGLPGGGGR